MTRSWTFGQKLTLGLVVTVAFSVIIGAVTIYALGTVVASKDHVIAVNAQNLVEAERLHYFMEHKVSSARGFLFTGDDKFLDQMQSARSDFSIVMERLRKGFYTDEGRRLLAEIDKADAEHQGALDRIITRRRTEASPEEVAKQFDTDVVPRREVLDQSLNAFTSLEQRLLDEGRRAASETASLAVTLVIFIAVAAVLLASGIALLLTRMLTRQIGSAVQHVQSSSSELQSAAGQQATGAREQATAMNEITTTIRELLATARQIAESAQRVAQIANETASSARGGDQVVQTARESVEGIKRQVDVIVTHMLELGKKSQQIGGILEIINELAEQTNILAINATIEAAGAGETGKRFAVVADEIRKLADRVGGSTKEIRALVDDIRASVNTTIMATEGGAKAVDAGTRQFGELATFFQRIVGLVETSTEAAKEIELSTKQQASAVEQVNVAISNVGQAAKESEASSSQTLQTSSQLTNLSRELARLIQAQAGA